MTPPHLRTFITPLAHSECGIAYTVRPTTEPAYSDLSLYASASGMVVIGLRCHAGLQEGFYEKDSRNIGADGLQLWLRLRAKYGTTDKEL
jgi:hypothetical protein